LSTLEGTPERRLARAEGVCLGSKEPDPYRDLERAKDNAAPRVCTRAPAYDAFSGHGQVDALNAIT
jgi:hypothetical protein